MKKSEHVLIAAGAGIGVLTGLGLLKSFDARAWAIAHRGDLVLALGAVVIVAIAYHYVRQGSRTRVQ